MLRPEVISIFNSFGVQSKTVKYADLVELFEDYSPKKNVSLESHAFNL